MPKLHLISLGCNKNLVDSEIMLGRLQNYDITDDISDADVIIVNTCGFIKSAKEESIQTILEMHEARKNGSLLVVTGCLMQRYKDELIKELPEVDLFTGVADYDKIDEIILKKQNLFSPETYLQTNEERVITGSNYHAYIKISEGCNQKCSFCAIPTFKGKLKSRSFENIVNEVKNLVKKGYYDFSFLSQDSSSYMRDHGVSDGLINLIDEIEKIEGVRSARILYLYPSTTSKELISRIITSPIFHNYFDMPIQHISENMLKIMKRGSGAKKIKELLNLMRNAKNSLLRTGVIVGHPGESEEIWAEAVENFKKFPITHLHAFVYSPRRDTHSATLKSDVSGDVAKARLKVLQGIAFKNNENFRKKHNGALKILVEQKNGDFYEGFDQFYNKAKISSQNDITKEWLEVSEYEIKPDANYAKI